MRSRPIAAVLVIAFLLAGIPVRPARAQEPASSEPRKIFLAVLELDCKGGLTPDECFLLTDTLREQFLLTGRFRVVDRNNMKTILKEQEFQLRDCTSEECAVKIGQLLGVEKMAFGSVGKLGDVFSLNLQIINVETGEIENAASDRCPCAVSELINPLTRLVLKVSGGLVKAQAGARPGDEPKAEEYGSLEVNTIPPGVAVYLDSELVGSAPVKIEKVPSGPHHLTLTRDGFATLAKGVMVKPGQTAHVEEMLVEQTGAVEIISIPPGADILVDEIPMGPAPKTIPGLKIGAHQVRLEHPDCLPDSDKVEIFYQKTVRLEKTLAGKPGKLLVTSTPPDAEVYLDGERKGKTNISLELPPGDHEVSVAKSGFLEGRMNIQIKPNKPDTLDFNLAPLAGAELRESTARSAGSRGKPWYKKGWVWAVIAGAAAVAGGVTAYELLANRDNAGRIAFRW